jgi:hypothetical protein
MASPIKKPVHDVGAASSNTSPPTNKNRTYIETANKKATHDWITAVAFRCKPVVLQKQQR